MLCLSEHGTVAVPVAANWHVRASPRSHAVGTTNMGEGYAECNIDCPAGFYWSKNGEGQGLCYPCPPGHACPTAK